MWGHTRKKKDTRNKERAEKQLLTVNSVNPVVLPPLNFILWLQYFSKLLPQYTIVIEKNQKSFIPNEYFLPKPFIRNE